MVHKQQQFIKMILGVVTLVPLAYFITLVGYIVRLLLSPVDFTQSEYFPILVCVHVTVCLWSYSLDAYYVVHAVRNVSLKRQQKTKWVIILVVLNVFALPVYWYQYIWSADALPQRNQSDG